MLKSATCLSHLAGLLLSLQGLGFAGTTVSAHAQAAAPAAPLVTVDSYVTRGISDTASVPKVSGVSYRWTVVTGKATLCNATTNKVAFLPDVPPGGTLPATLILRCTVTNSAGSASGTGSTTVVALPRPAITVDTTVPAGGTLTARVADQPECTYAWTVLGGRVVEGANAPAFTFRADTGKYAFLTCVVTNRAGFALLGAAAVRIVAAPVGTTQTTLALSPWTGTAVYGAPATLVATVTSPAGTPSGTVTFWDGALALGTRTLGASGDPAGAASLALSSLAAGPHAFTAQFSGTSGFQNSTSALVPLTVNWTTTLSLSVTPVTPLVLDQPAEFTATVAYGGGTSGVQGTVALVDAVTGAEFTSGRVGSDNKVSLAVKYFMPPPFDGTRTPPSANLAVKAVFRPDAGFLGSTSDPLILNFLQGVSRTTLASTYDPASPGQAVTFTASVLPVVPGVAVPTGAWFPTGKVEFRDGTTLLGTGNLSSPATAIGDPIPAATATFTTSAALAGHTVTATYVPEILEGATVPAFTGSSDSLDLPAPVTATGTFATLGSLAATPRSGHTLTLLPDGRILVAGGDAGSFGTAELHDPADATKVLGFQLSGPRSGHTATLLADGKVLLAGGRSGATVLDTAEILDPDAFTSATASAISLGNLNAAGTSGSGTTDGSVGNAASALVTSPIPLASARAGHTATLLADGTVFLAGGLDPSGNALATAEILNPATRVSTPAQGSLLAARSGHTATLLRDGTVLLAGGRTTGTDVLATAEAYYPPKGQSTSLALAGPRTGATAIQLPDESVLLVGGSDGAAPLATVERINGSASSPAPALANARISPAATLLFNGTILVAGGTDLAGNVRTSAEILDPANGSATLPPVSLDAATRAALLPTGKVLLATGSACLLFDNQDTTLPPVPDATLTLASTQVAADGSTPLAGSLAALTDAEKQTSRFSWTVTGTSAPTGQVGYGTPRLDIASPVPTASPLKVNALVTTPFGIPAAGSGTVAVAPGVPVIAISDGGTTATGPLVPGKAYTATVANASSGITYTWSLTGGTLNGPASDSPCAFTAGAPGTLVLTCVAADPVTLTTSTGSLERAVASLPAPVISFTATPETIDSGGTATLTWVVTGADTVTLDDGTVSKNVSSKNSMLVTPATTTRYSLLATGPGGTTVAEVTLTVNDPVIVLPGGPPVLTGL